MAQVIIYTTLVCPYCEGAKNLFKEKGIDYTEIRVDEQKDKLTEMLEKSKGSRTVPQIFIDDYHIGGFEDLKSLNESGKLDSLLNS